MRLSCCIAIREVLVTEIHLCAFLTVAYSWKDACWAGETLCTFREALDVIMAIPGKGCFPEIKGGDLAIVSMLQRIVMETGVTPAQVSYHVRWIDHRSLHSHS